MWIFPTTVSCNNVLYKNYDTAYISKQGRILRLSNIDEIADSKTSMHLYIICSNIFYLFSKIQLTAGKK